MYKECSVGMVKKSELKASKTKQNRSKNYIFWGLCSIPLLFLVLVLVNKLVAVPFWDSWEFSTILQKHDQGTLGFSDFFAQHNEHRILFPRLAMYLLAIPSSWDVRWESWFSVFLASATFVLLGRMLMQTIKNKKLTILTGLLLSTLFFSPIQWENWMWGWQIQWFMNVFCVIGALYAIAYLNRSSKTKIAIAAALGIIATYSLASGFFLWVILAPLVYIDKNLRKYTPIWLAIATATILSHYIGYVDPAYHPSKSIFLDKPLEFIAYFLTYIARPITHDFLWASHIGAVYIASAVIGFIYLVKYHWSVFIKLLPWLALGLYGVFAAASTAISRVGFGVQQGYSNRYITLSNLFLIPVVIMFVKIIELNITQKQKAVLRDKIARSFSAICLGLICFMVLLNIYRGLQQTEEQHLHLVKIKKCAETAKSVDDPCLLGLYPNAEVVWERLQFVRETNRSGL